MVGPSCIYRYNVIHTNLFAFCVYMLILSHRNEIEQSGPLLRRGPASLYITPCNTCTYMGLYSISNFQNNILAVTQNCVHSKIFWRLRLTSSAQFSARKSKQKRNTCEGSWLTLAYLSPHPLPAPRRLARRSLPSLAWPLWPPWGPVGWPPCGPGPRWLAWPLGPGPCGPGPCAAPPLWALVGRTHVPPLALVGQALVGWTPCALPHPPPGPL